VLGKAGGAGVSYRAQVQIISSLPLVPTGSYLDGDDDEHEMMIVDQFRLPTPSLIYEMKIK
jgi:hypothetical protein